MNENSPFWHPDVSWDPVVRLRAGLYSEFLKDWFQVFPRDQFYIVTLEYFSKNTAAELERMYSFLGLSPYVGKKMEKAINNVNRVTKTVYKIPFLNETRKILLEFYYPYNVKLSKLLQAEDVFWDRS